MKKLIMMMFLAVMAFTVTPSFSQTKKDGTKDMRYKANKTAPAVMKKDGTPDMRYKSSKTSSKTTVVKKTTAKKN